MQNMCFWLIYIFLFLKVPSIHHFLLALELSCGCSSLSREAQTCLIQPPLLALPEGFQDVSWGIPRGSFQLAMIRKPKRRCPWGNLTRCSNTSTGSSEMSPTKKWVTRPHSGASPRGGAYQRVLGDLASILGPSPNCRRSNLSRLPGAMMAPSNTGLPKLSFWMLQ